MPKPTHRLVTSALHRVRLPVGRLRRSLDQFQPLMPCTPSDGAGDYVAGKCLWGLVGAKEMVAVCWDWVGWWWDDTWVVALANPMAITSNVILLDDAGVPLKSSAALLEFNTAVHCLKWQGWVTSEVCAWARSTASRKVVQTESPRCLWRPCGILRWAVEHAPTKRMPSLWRWRRRLTRCARAARWPAARRAVSFESSHLNRGSIAVGACEEVKAELEFDHSPKRIGLQSSHFLPPRSTGA